MDRVAGWYKKRTQSTVLIIAALDLHPRQRRHDHDRHRPRQQCRPARVDRRPGQGLRREQQGIANGSQARGDRDSGKNLQKVGVPLGWTAPPWKSLDFPLGWLNKLAGLALTTFAVSLGAPFWFDLLNKFMNIRSAGKAPDEKQK